MSASRLRVVYANPEVDEELDKKITEFFESLNWICIDKVHHAIIHRREIFFETQEEIDANKKIVKTMENL